MKSHEVRSAFLNYFKKHHHEIVPSSSLIPQDDPTLLFTNAGMNQFKGVFLGLESRDRQRAVSSQKCVRAGGKHNDLENVGHTARHHTFFEMLGNFSFGDYFKQEAIHFAWNLITKEFGLPKDRLYVSVFEQDDEAAKIWHQQEGVPKDRIYRFGEKDNFWRMGNSGPCGPCSEIFYDLGPEVGGDPRQNVMGGDGDRFMEIWNLVFMQFNESENGEQTPLPRPSIDTGAGLERMTSVLQGELSNYHIDTFSALINVAMKVSGHEYLKDLSRLKEKEKSEREALNVAFRVVADHSRAAAFLMADGVLPSNEGRGYVLRRILRRGIRFAQQLTTEKSLMVPVVEKVIQEFGDTYPELLQQKTLILSTMEDEESRFCQTLAQGTQLLNEALEQASSIGKKNPILSGDVVFKLYDTFGFPLDLTRLIAAERGIQVNEPEFEQRMDAARKIAKASWKGHQFDSHQAHYLNETQKLLRQQGPTRFTGYRGNIQSQGEVLLLANQQESVSQLKKGERGILVCDSTCFYAESGGQVGDVGLMIGNEGRAQVIDTTRLSEIHLHHIEVTEGFIAKGHLVQQRVRSQDRLATASNHSATHLLHAALRKVLGDHVHQAGSLVDARRLRFDFTHPRSLSEQDICQIEDLVNQEISAAHLVETNIMTPQAATDAGALALFGEKYGDEVRVVKMGGFSMELCGGTHVENTAMIRLFKVASESSVSSGVRRIEAITGDLARTFLLQHTRENLKARFQAGLQETMTLPDWIEKQKDEVKQLHRQIGQMKAQLINVDELLATAKPFQTQGQAGQLVMVDIPMDDRKVLSEVGDKIRHQLQSGVVIMIGQGEQSHPIIVSLTKNLVGTLNAGHILKEISQEMGGKGGGRPDFAQGSAPQREKLPQAFAKARQLLGLS